MSNGQFFCRECGGFTVINEAGDVVSDSCTCGRCQSCGKECGH